MSDTEFETVVHGTTKLAGPDNYSVWNRSLLAALAAKNLIEHISEELSVIQAATTLRYPVSSPATASELQKLQAAFYRDKQNQGTTFGIIYHSLSTVVQNRIPDSHVQWLKPEPKRLYNWLQTTYSASSAARQAELWKGAWEMRGEENEDPQAGLASIRARLGEVAASAISNKVSLADFLDNMTAYAMLAYLPPSYGMLASTLLASNSTITSDQVLSASSLEWRRRMMQAQEINGQGLLAKRDGNRGQGRTQDRRERKLGKDGLPLLGGDATKFCEEHKRWGHDINNCFRRSGGREQGKDKPKVAMAAQDTAQPDLDAYIALSSISITSSIPGQVIIDSAASDHWICDKRLLKDLVPLTKQLSVKVGNGSTVSATHSGTLCIGRVAFDNAYYVPDMVHNLLAVRRLGNSSEHSWTFTPTSAWLSNKAGDRLIEGELFNGLYVVRPSYLALSATADRPSWHSRLGHINLATIEALGRSGRLGDDWKQDQEHAQCSACIQGKGARLPSLPSTNRATHPADRVSADLWGPAPTPSMGGSLYFLTCYDDCSRYVYTKALKRKSEASAALQHFINQAETQTGRQVKVLRTDRGGEFMSKELAFWLSQKGVQHVQTPPDAHTQNGRVGRAHLTLANDMRTLLIDSQLPERFWAEAVAYATYNRNRVMINSAGKTPEDLWTSQQTSLLHLQPFGQRVYYRVHQQQDKLQPRYLPGRLMGYTAGATSYRIYNPTSRQFVTSRDVIFKQEAQYNTAWSLPISNTPDNPGAPEEQDEQPDQVQEPQAVVDEVQQPAVGAEEATYSPFEGQRNWLKEKEYLDRISNLSDNQLSPRDRALRQRWKNSTIEPAVTRTAIPQPAELTEYGRGKRNRQAHMALIDNNTYIALAAAATDPQTYQQARESAHWPDWEAAVAAELANMAKYDVWEPVPRANHRSIPGKWVFTRKIDGETGKPAKFKARYVVKGFRQVQGKDYNDIFASVAHKDSIRVFLSIVNYLGIPCHQVDIKGAFLNGDIDVELYVDPPEGMPISAGHVLRLKRSLYGLKQSPHLFNKALDQWLQQQGLKPTKADPCIYIRRTESSLLLLSIHVDDQLIACSNQEQLNEFKRQLNNRFECSNGGPVNYFLGINVYRDIPGKQLYLSQEHYLESLLERFGMSNCQPSRTILPSDFKPVTPTDEEFEAAKQLDFPSMAGGILYAATITRPDLAYAAGLLCRFISKWNESIYKAAKHVLRYIRGTTDLCLTFDGSGSQRVVLGYADADWGGCLNTRRSTTGYVFKTYGGITAWKSRRQPSTALSTTHAELLATTDAARQAEWLQQLLDDLGMGLPTGVPVSLYNDNAGAVLLAQHPHDHKMTKHFDIRANYLREKRADKAITVEKVSTNDNLADILTKSLSSHRHDHLATELGMTLLPRALKRGGETESELK
jgi:transposase InsO family protein